MKIRLCLAGGMTALALRVVAAEVGGAVAAAEFVNDPMPTPSCHASTLIETENGLAVAWFGGTREGDSDVGIWLSRQEAGKWLPAQEVATGVQADGTTRYPCWNPVLFQPKDSPLMLFYKVGPTPAKWWGEVMTSADCGKTWSVARHLPQGILGPIKNKPVQLPCGDILAPTSSEHDGWRVHFERSSDNGATWVATPPVNDGKAIGAIQPSVLLLKDGTLQAVGRTRQKKVFNVRSSDGGKTWGEMALLDLSNPNSGTDAVTLKDGRHLLVYNPVTQGRSPLVVALSEDGTTWKEVLTLEDEPKKEFSYPAVIQAADGNVHITYTWKRLKVRHVVVDLAKVDVSN